MSPACRGSGAERHARKLYAYTKVIDQGLTHPYHAHVPVQPIAASWVFTLGVGDLPTKEDQSISWHLGM